MAALHPAHERRLLQAAVLAGGLVPVTAGLTGALFGLDALDPATGTARDGDSHARYLSGLLLAIGLSFWTTVPRIEAHGRMFRLLTAIVFVGGLARLLGAIIDGLPGPGMTFGLAMELIVTPALALWRERVARRVTAMAAEGHP